MTPPEIPRRLGITIPFDGIPLAEHGQWFEHLRDWGYTDVWSSEVDGADGFTPLALAAAATPTLHLGVAIAPVFTRGPALLAQTVAAMADAAPGRFAAGLGASSDTIVQGWNGIDFDRPYERVRDTLRFLRSALGGEKVDAGGTLDVRGFRLSRPPAVAPPLYLGALRSGMLRLAGREADGVVLNWLAATDVATALAEVHEGARQSRRPASTPAAVARIFVVPNPDPDVARAVGRRMIAAYLNVPAYAEFHRWLGRGERLDPMWRAWQAGDRRGALAAIPDDVVDELVVHGPPQACRDHVDRYVDAGITVPVLAVVPFGTDLAEALRQLAGAT